MPDNYTYENRIKSFDWDAMSVLWRRICDRTTAPDWSEGRALEYFVIRGFELSGAEVVYPYQVNLQEEMVEQIDGVVYFEGIAAIVECKDYRPDRKIDFEPIAKLNTYLQRRNNSVIGCILSMSGFTEPAQILADYVPNRTILLWERNEIDYALNNQNFADCLRAKYRYYVEHGTNDTNFILL